MTLVLGIDTATAATAAAVWTPDGVAVEARDDPAPGARPAHATRLLALVEEALAGAGAGWEDVTRIAVGVGPGGFTGLRHGIATARALAQARDLPLAGVSSLEALAAGRRRRRPSAGRPRRHRRPPRRGLRRRLARRRAAARARRRRARRSRRPPGRRPARGAAGRGRRGGTLQGGARAGRGRRSGGLLPRSTGSARCRSAGSARRGRSPTATRWCPTTAESPTPPHPSPDVDRPSRRRHRGPPSHVRRPAPGRRDRAPRLHDPLVAGDVRARAVQAERRLPGGRGRATARTELVGYLVCSRYDLVWHIMNVSVDPDRRRRGIATALLARAVRPRRRPRGAVHARGPALQPRGVRALRPARLQAGRRPPPLLRRQRRGRDRHVAHPGDPPRHARRRAQRRGRQRRAPARVTILALETSCDDTCAAVITARRGDPLQRRLLPGRARPLRRRRAGDRLAPPPRAGQRRRRRRAGPRGHHAGRDRHRRRHPGPRPRRRAADRRRHRQGPGRRAAAAARAGRPPPGPRRRQLPRARPDRAAVPVPDRLRRAHAARPRDRARRPRAPRQHARRRRRRGVRQGRPAARPRLSRRPGALEARRAGRPDGVRVPHRRARRRPRLLLRRAEDRAAVRGARPGGGGDRAAAPPTSPPPTSTRSSRR